MRSYEQIFDDLRPLLRMAARAKHRLADDVRRRIAELEEEAMRVKAHEPRFHVSEDLEAREGLLELRRAQETMRGDLRRLEQSARGGDRVDTALGERVYELEQALERTTRLRMTELSLRVARLERTTRLLSSLITVQNEILERR